MRQQLDRVERQGMDSFVKSAEASYRKKLEGIPLFDRRVPLDLSPLQKQQFAGVFYHLRGHFHDFLWYLLNYAPSEDYKRILIDNISEEAGDGGHMSHERLYELFAVEYGVDIRREFVEQKYYYPFAKAFNAGHVDWLSQHDWAHCYGAYAAYERLDNIDYVRLLDMAERMGSSRKGLAFFHVHTQVEHFEQSSELLLSIWKENPDSVKDAFKFIFDHQFQMWSNLSDMVFCSLETIAA